jgi:hypothetical protein
MNDNIVKMGGKTVFIVPKRSSYPDAKRKEFKMNGLELTVFLAVERKNMRI